MTVTETSALTMARRFDASPERLFDAWTDPHLAAAWLFTGPQSEVHTVEMDLWVGGRWEVTDRRGGVDYRALGQYLEIDRPRRLVFTFGMPQFSEAFDTVTVEIAPDGTGSLMTLTQERLPPSHVAATEEGWRRMFEGLEGRLTQGGYGAATGPGTLRFERLFPGPVERLWTYVTDPELRGRWLAKGPMELAPGGRMELHFRHIDLSPVLVEPPERYAAMKAGATVTGRVIALEPPRMIQFSWGDGEGASEVTVELAEQGDQVLMTLTQTRLKDAAEMANVGAGWHTHLTILADATAGREPAPFWSLWKGTEEEYAKRLGKG